MTERTATLLPASLLVVCLAMAMPAPSSAAETPAALPSLVPRAASVQAMPGRLVLADNAHFVARDARAKQVLAQLSRLAGDALPQATLHSTGRGGSARGQRDDAEREQHGDGNAGGDGRWHVDAPRGRGIVAKKNAGSVF